LKKRTVKIATIHSRCECQAALGADLDEHKNVVHGWAVERERKERQPSPAQSIRPDRDRFDVSWFCPFCVRNTLRAFATSALAYHERPPEPAATPPTGSNPSPAAG
jgi:hypothetical protein